MFYSEDLIEEIRTRNDIVDVISGYVKLKRQGGTYFGLCPFHNEKSPSFSVTPAKQMYYCFGCGAGGNVFTFLMEYENFSFPEAVKFLADRCGIDLPEQEFSEELRKQADLKQTLLEIQKEAAKFFYYQIKQEGSRKALDYLHNRELSDETIQKFGLGYAGKYSDSLYHYLKKKGYSDILLKESGLFVINEKQGVQDKFWNRIMFPIMDSNHRVIGFGGRVMGDGKPKYLNSPETKVFDKSRNLYGLNFARSSRKGHMIICEGYMDVIALHQAGFTQAVASLGTAFTLQQSILIKRYTEEVLLSYDSDEAGRKAAMRAIPILKEAGLRVRVIDMNPYKDPDEFIKNLGVEAFQKRIEEAVNGFIFEIHTLEKSFHLDDPAEKTSFYETMAKKLLEFEEELERNNYIEAVAKDYGISYESLKKRVDQLGLKLGGVSPTKEIKSGIQKKKDDGALVSQRLLLTFMVSDEVLFQKIKRWISPDEFTYPLYREVATLLYEQYEKGGLRPAAIINRFTEAEEQREVAGVFNTILQQIDTKEANAKALQETIQKVKRIALEEATEKLDPMDLVGLQKLVMKKRELEKLHISFE